MPKHELLGSQRLHASTLPSAITLRATPSTDVWCVPPAEHHFSAPFACLVLPAASFRSITAAVSASFTANTQQGGLLLTLPPRGGTEPAQEGRRWVTATLEYEHGRSNVSVVGCDHWADWSLQGWDGGAAVLRMERRPNADGSMGPRLIVSLRGADGVWTIIREVAWAFAEAEGDIWVGVLANQATPTDGGGDAEGVEVRFDDVKVEMA